jgi:hypothetical protein
MIDPTYSRTLSNYRLRRRRRRSPGAGGGKINVFQLFRPPSFEIKSHLVESERMTL